MLDREIISFSTVLPDGKFVSFLFLNHGGLGHSLIFKFGLVNQREELRCAAQIHGHTQLKIIKYAYMPYFFMAICQSQKKLFPFFYSFGQPATPTNSIIHNIFFSSFDWLSASPFCSQLSPQFFSLISHDSRQPSPFPLFFFFFFCPCTPFLFFFPSVKSHHFPSLLPLSLQAPATIESRRCRRVIFWWLWMTGDAGELSCARGSLGDLDRFRRHGPSTGRAGLGSEVGEPPRGGEPCEAPMTEMEEGRASGVQSTPAGERYGTFSYFPTSPAGARPGLGSSRGCELVCAGGEPWQQPKPSRSDHFSICAFSLSLGLSL